MAQLLTEVALADLREHPDGGDAAVAPAVLRREADRRVNGEAPDTGVFTVALPADLAESYRRTGDLGARNTAVHLLREYLHGRRWTGPATSGCAGGSGWN